MADSLSITILLIFLFSFAAAFIRGRMKDRCLNNFSKNMILLEETNGKLIKGVLRVETTGVELIYPSEHNNNDLRGEKSYILYKNEYSNIQTFIRYIDLLDEPSKRKRTRELQRTYHPSYLRRINRKTRNFFCTIRDSVIDVVNLLIGRVKHPTLGGVAINPQDKYVSKVKDELLSPLANTFEPLLENHIGKRVILELNKVEKTIKFPCVLKDYTAEFIELMDVDYSIKEGEPTRKADLVIPRKFAIVRHLGE